MKKPLGFAAMDPATRRIVQRMGVLASLKSPKRHKFTRVEAQAAANKLWESRRDIAR